MGEGPGGCLQRVWVGGGGGGCAWGGSDLQAPNFGGEFRGGKFQEQKKHINIKKYPENPPVRAPP